MHPVPQLFDPETFVGVLAATLVGVVAVIGAVLLADSALARLRARRRRARSTGAAVESA
jgi:hypothetical protein